MRSPEEPGKARRSQGEPGGAQRSQEEPGGAMRSQEEPGEARRSQEEPGGARRSQEEPEGARRSRKRPGKKTKAPRVLQWLGATPNPWSSWVSSWPFLASPERPCKHLNKYTAHYIQVSSMHCRVLNGQNTRLSIDVREGERNNTTYESPNNRCAHCVACQRRDKEATTI